MATWRNAEANVRIAAASIWGKDFKSSLVHGRQIDAYAVLDEKRCVAVEVTEVKNINKIQDDLNKLIHVLGWIYSNGMCLRNNLRADNSNAFRRPDNKYRRRKLGRVSS
jgi:hypothetical protein